LSASFKLQNLAQNPHVYIVCGEASGDLHAANLVAAWKTLNPQIHFSAWGGDRLQAQGVQLEQHIRAMSFMGFLEVLQNLGTIRRQFKQLQQSLLAQKPDLLVLVDYPGFNLRMAKWAKDHDIKVLYYISPTVWAWKQNRVYKIQKYVAKMYCILPFEPAFYARFGIEVAYFGHPLQDEINRFRHTASSCLSFEKPILALLPGSRPQELAQKLPLMLAAAGQFKATHQIVVACAQNIPKSVYEAYCMQHDVFLSEAHTYDLLSKAELALVTSGTATLETALFNVPQVVCYKGAALSIWLARKLVHIKYISLVNLILDKSAVPELIQEECTVEKMQKALQEILPGQVQRAEQLANYAQLQDLLKQSGVSDRIANSMNSYLVS
jgi:lipid-A-disaccharide synthase